MRIGLLGVTMCSAVVAASCASHTPSSTHDEDCSAVGDEDGNGVADCSDPACASAPACSAKHSIGGQVTGLAGSGLMLTTNGKTVSVAAPVSYTHLRAHETPEHLVCRL